MGFVDNSAIVKANIEGAILAWLYETSGELKSQTQRNSRVDTGSTKNSFQHKIDVAGLKGYVGSNHQNAIWEEFGTGIYAEQGGRQTPWSYQDLKGNWHRTFGKKKTRAFRKAYRSVRPLAVKALEAKLARLR